MFRISVTNDEARQHYRHASLCDCMQCVANGSEWKLSGLIQSVVLSIMLVCHQL